MHNIILTDCKYKSLLCVWSFGAVRAGGLGGGRAGGLGGPSEQVVIAVGPAVVKILQL